MEIMALPKKETLIFFDEVDDWIVKEDVTEYGVEFVFEKNTPDSVLTLFENIKDKLNFKVKSYRVEN